MTTPTTPSLIPDPAQRADACSRLTRTIAAILQQRVFHCQAVARDVAADVAEGLIDEYGGNSLYVPIQDRRAGLTNHDAIERSLRVALAEVDAARGDVRLPLVQTVRQIAIEHSVSDRTVFRVLQRMRAGL